MDMKNKKFAALIISHKRPDRVITYSTLKKSGYTGRVVIILDDEDPTIEKYKQKFKDEVYVFNKKTAEKNVNPAIHKDEKGTCPNGCVDGVIVMTGNTTLDRPRSCPIHGAKEA